MRDVLHVSLLPILLALASAVAASPVLDRQADNLSLRKGVTLFPLARRHASGHETRHLRPEDYLSLAKRDEPDLGQIQPFDGDPQPIRGALGATFLSNSNHEIDKQNVDNVAAPLTDAGE